MVLVSLIAATSQQFLKLSKLFLTRYRCSLWSAWKQSAEFFFVNLRPMGGVSSLIRMLQCLCAIMAVTFFAQLSFVLGLQFLGLLLLNSVCGLSGIQRLKKLFVPYSIRFTAGVDQSVTLEGNSPLTWRIRERAPIGLLLKHLC